MIKINFFFCYVNEFFRNFLVEKLYEYEYVFNVWNM